MWHRRVTVLKQQKEREVRDLQRRQDEEIADYQLQLQQRDKEIADYQLQLQQKDTKIADYQLQLQQKDTAQHQKDKATAEPKGNPAALQEVATSACELWFSETTLHQCQGRTGTNCLQGRVQEGLSVSLTFHKERGCCLLVVTAIS